MFTFNVQNLFVGGSSPYNSSFESIATRTIEGVQSAQIALTYPRQDEFSWDGNGDRFLIERPRVDLTFNYLPVSGSNEIDIGFFASPPISALASLNNERNYYLLINQNGIDAIGYTGTNSQVVALGNGVLRRYEFRSAVGQATNVTATVECLNALIQNSGGSGQILPSIYKQTASGVTGTYVLPMSARTIGLYPEVAPSNIVLTFNTGSAFGALLSGQNSCPLQSFEFTVDIPRQDSKDLGWAYPNTRPVQWPVSIGLRADAYLNPMQLDALNRGNCPDSGYAFSVGFQNACNSLDAFSFSFVGAKLDTETISAQIGNSDKISFNWSMKIMDPQRSGVNFYISPGNRVCYNSGDFPQVNWGTGITQLPLVLTFGTCCFLDVLSGPTIIDSNNIYVSDEPAVTVLRVSESGTSSYQDVTLTVT